MKHFLHDIKSLNIQDMFHIAIKQMQQKRYKSKALKTYKIDISLNWDNENVILKWWKQLSSRPIMITVFGVLD